MLLTYSAARKIVFSASLQHEQQLLFTTASSQSTSRQCERTSGTSAMGREIVRVFQLSQVICTHVVLQSTQEHGRNLIARSRR